MMDRLEAMSILLRVVNTGSFSAAGRELRIPLATVSRKVSELEAHLGTRLLVRTTRRVALTETGAVYVATARRILEQVEDAERQAAGEFKAPRGQLVLTAPVLFGRLHILPVVMAFLAAYPDINVQLLLADRNLHLVEEHVDMAVRIGPLPDSLMVATKVGVMRMVTCASPGLLARYGTPAIPADIAALPVVAFDSGGHGVTAWRFMPPGERNTTEVPVKPRLSVTTAEAAVSAAVQGVGVTRVLLYQCAEAVRDGSLQVILPTFEPEPAPVHLLHAGQGALPSKMQVFLQFAAGRLRQRLAQL